MASAESDDDVFHETTRGRVSEGNANMGVPRPPGMTIEGVLDELIRFTRTGKSAKGSLSADNGNAVVTVLGPEFLLFPEVAPDPGGAIGDATVSGRFTKVGMTKCHVDLTYPWIGGEESETFIVGISEDVIMIGIEINDFQGVLEKTRRDREVKADCREGQVFVPR